MHRDKLVWRSDKRGSIGSYEAQGFGGSSREEFLGGAVSDEDALGGLRCFRRGVLPHPESTRNRSFTPWNK